MVNAAAPGKESKGFNEARTSGLHSFGRVGILKLKDYVGQCRLKWSRPVALGPTAPYGELARVGG